jgi:hypothetical protein
MVKGWRLGDKITIELCEVIKTSSVSCPLAGFLDRHIECSGSTTRKVVTVHQYLELCLQIHIESTEHFVYLFLFVDLLYSPSFSRLGL